VISLPFDSASSTLQGKGFAVARVDVDAPDPKGTVVGQDPAPDTLQAPGTKVTLSVSKGPKTSTVPTVTSLSQQDAIAQLRTSGFRVKIVTQVVSDPNQEGIVQTQDPAGGSLAPPGTVVTIAVGKSGGTTTGPR
jgi:serine/threonine-protein kinase